MTDDEMLIQKQLGMEWEREVAIPIIARLLMVHEKRDMATAMKLAESMLRTAEDERIENEVRP